MTLHQALKFFELDSLDGQDGASLKKIYYRLAQIYHPDKGGSFELFILLQESYLFLKQNLLKNSNFEDDIFENPNQSDQNYPNFQTKYNQLREYLNEILKVVENYEIIFKHQINIINGSNDSIRALFSTHERLKSNLQEQLDRNLLQIKKNYEKTWWEYILPSRKLTQEQYIQASNSQISDFNHAIKVLDEELVTQILKSYRASFQDLINLLSDI